MESHSSPEPRTKAPLKQPAKYIFFSYADFIQKQIRTTMRTDSKW